MLRITAQTGNTFPLAEVLIMIEANRPEKLRARKPAMVSRLANEAKSIDPLVVGGICQQSNK
jgi:hypothetical protein